MATRAPASFGAFSRKPNPVADATEQDEGAADIAAQQQDVVATPAAGTDDGSGHWPDDLIEVGVIGEAYGVRGWVKIYPHAGGAHEAAAGDSALLTAKRWWLVKGAERRVAQVLMAKRHSSTVVAQLSGSADRNAGEAWKGWRVSVRRADFPRLASADEFYWVDLIGLDVVNQEGVDLGTVTDLIDNGAHSILRVAYEVPAGQAQDAGKDVAGKDEGKGAAGKGAEPAGGERLIPFVERYIKHVDQAAKKIVVDWGTDY
jgi:16S rRNA processing protein RimM